MILTFYYATLTSFSVSQISYFFPLSYDGNSLSVKRLKSNSRLPKKYLICFDEKFINDEKCFLFHLESSFPSEVFKNLSLLFGHVEKTG